ncbi:hypothetical protein FRB99_003725 [Tulasnella sp. 403]|nr:hypothetical protein FRB99_003725 [Tulasnella sp. 403]
MGKGKQKKTRSRKAQSPDSHDSLDDIFDSSPTPPDWDEASDKDWEVDKIVDRHIPLSGPTWYKVAWADWKRSDGSNTTWMKESDLHGARQCIDDFHEKRRAALKRVPLNEEFINEDHVLEADINPNMLITDNPVHPLSERTVLSTFRRARKRNLEDLTEETLRWVAEADKNAKKFERLFGRNEALDVPNDEWMRSPSPDEDHEMSPVEPPRRSLRSVPTQNPDVWHDDLEDRAPPLQVRDSSVAGLQPSVQVEDDESRIAGGLLGPLVQDLWDKELAHTGAASVEVVNSDSSDDEDAPPLPIGFKYMENRCDM